MKPESKCSVSEHSRRNGVLKGASIVIVLSGSGRCIKATHVFPTTKDGTSCGCGKLIFDKEEYKGIFNQDVLEHKR